MGVVQENGNGGEMGGVVLGSKNKYRRMDSEMSEDIDDDASHHHHAQQDRISSTRKYVIACAVFASLNSVLLGYDVGVMSGAIMFIQKDLNITEVQEEVLVGCLSIVSLFGSLAGGRTSDVIGRKWTMAFSALVFQTGAAVMTLASSFEILMVGRFLAGIGIGFGIMIAPVYIAEISPSVARGSFTSFPEIFINLGILLGYVSNYAFSNLPVHINWRIMLAVGILPSVFIGFALFIIPESPRWLVMQDRVDEARSVLLKTIDNDAEVEERLAEILQAAGSTEEKYEQKPVWRELLSPSPSVRRMLVVGFGIQCFQQITGIDATVYYSPEIFQKAGIKDETKLLAATVAVGVSKTAFIMVAILLIDKVGRKPLLYVSTIGMTFCLFSLGATLTFFDEGQLGIGLSILFVCANVAFFSVGIGPVCWVLTSEIFPLRLRAQAGALGAVGNRVSSGLVAMSFLSVSRAISVGGTFFIFSLISALSVAFVYTLVPETKGKSLEQIELLFKDESEWKGGEVELGDVEHLVQKQLTHIEPLLSNKSIYELATVAVFLVGKDFGAVPAYLVAVLHPEKVSGVITLGIPFMMPGPQAVQTDLMPKGFYITRWQEPGRAEADFGRFDVKKVIRNIYILFSGAEVPTATEDQEIMDLFDPSTPLPPWFSEEDLAAYASLYENSGFGFPLQVYLVGADLGSFPAYMVASLYPERVLGLVSLGIPFLLPGPTYGVQTDLMPKGFYVLRWQEPGRAEADFGRFDMKTVIRNIYILFSGSELPTARDDQEIMDLVDPSTPLPPWFTEEDLATYASLYENSGFRFPLQVPYR
ncbi:putative polyol transporter 4 [Turnera subulata]|uniref:Polyol transporter 4 n=1 Tax=Turnera subulata TaxID=218843 RepID=A0A9Q0J183_9ROSI|nr:putative polyol transporter 4 [Turnera subulata]